MKKIVLVILIFFRLQILVYSQNTISEGLLQLAKDAQLRRNDSFLQTFVIADLDESMRWRYVYWPESHYLIRLPNNPNKDEAWDNMGLVARFIDLEEDVVSSREEIGSSTYLEYEETMAGYLKKCFSGTVVVVLRLNGECKFLEVGESVKRSECQSKRK